MIKGRTFGTTVLAALVVCLGAGTAFAGTPYEPVVSGNDYGNAVDEDSGYGIEGIYYAGSFGQQNADTVAAARELDVAIGQDEEGASPVVVTNATGKAIASLSVQVNDEAASANLLSGTLGKDASACWYFVYSDKTETRQNLVGVEHRFPPHYTLAVTFDDGSAAEFHDLNMAAVRTVDLCYDEPSSTYFAVRTTVSNHTPDSMLAYEQNRAAAQDVEAYVDANNTAIVSSYMASPADFPYYAMGLMNHEPLQQVENFTVAQPLYCTTVGESVGDCYADIRWNRDTLPWRDARE